MTNGMKHILPEDYSPSEYDFVIGRGKAIKQSKGNARLYNQIRAIADDYTAADKATKSHLLSRLVSQVYENSPGAGFVKKDPTNGRWYEVEDALARASAAQAVRDCLHNHYKSSRQFKQHRRRQAKQDVTITTDTTAAAPTMDEDNLSISPFSCSQSIRPITPDQGLPSRAFSSHPNDFFSILVSAFASWVNEQEDPFLASSHS
jgi:hypothetical protein